MDLSDVQIKRAVKEAEGLADDLGVPVDVFLRDAVRHYVQELKFTAGVRMCERGERDVNFPSICDFKFMLNKFAKWAPVEAWLRREQRGPVQDAAATGNAPGAPTDSAPDADAQREEPLLADLVNRTLSPDGARELRGILLRSRDAASDDVMRVGVEVLLRRLDALVPAA